MDELMSTEEEAPILYEADVIPPDAATLADYAATAMRDAQREQEVIAQQAARREAVDLLIGMGMPEAVARAAVGYHE